MSLDLAAQMWELFQGRTDIIGNADDPTRPIRAEHGNDPASRMKDHLDGFRSIGVYPMVLQWDMTKDPKDAQVPWWQVRWGCIDFDEGYDQSWPDAVNVKNVLAEFGITAWIEKTRSKGWHVWVFASEWVPARTMRRALLAACQVVGAPTKEINPKQETLEEGGVGNFVRLPYPGNQSNEEHRQQVLHYQGEILHIYHGNAESFVREALTSRCTATQLEELEGLYREPVKPKFERLHPPPPSLDGWPALVRRIIEDEPFEKRRSDQMTRIAYLMADAGFDRSGAYAAVEAADDRWGKYVGRKDRELLLEGIVSRAYD